MGDAASGVTGAKPLEEACGGCGGSTPAAAAHGEFPEQGASVAWAHLQPEERKSIRATSRAGRQLHDRLTTHLRLTLGRDPDPNEQQQEQQQQQHQPSPRELRESLGAVVRRGGRLQSLTVWFRDASDGRREAQLLAALEACSGCPLTRLELEGAVPVSRVVAEAVEARCPQLSSLRLNHGARPPGLSAAVPGGEAATEYHHGCVQLLTLCGPRLRELRLVGVHDWRDLSYMAMRNCTALTALVLEAGESDPFFPSEVRYLESPAMEALVFSAVAQLPSLRSLHLTTSLNQETWSPEALRPYATCVACLSALTALTRLQLNPSFGYYDRGDSRRSMGRDPNRDDLMREVWAAHHTSLLSALRCMPQLQSLTASALWLRPSELAPLTSLTSITVPGLLPDLERPSVTAQGSAAGGATLLPPHLQELLLGGASPRALAELRPQQALSRLCAHRMRFGVSDVDTAGRLRAEAVAAVGPAVRLLTTYRDPTCKLVVVHIANDARHSPLLPPEGVPNGHMEWIRQLQGLDGAFRMVTLEGLALGPGDLSCLGESLRDLERLALWDCSFPLVALPLLRFPMLRLERLELDLWACEGVSNTVLAPLLLSLCRPHSGALPLQQLTCMRCPQHLDQDRCTQYVLEHLENDFGVTGVSLLLR